jgi:hypothetical protein
MPIGFLGKIAKKVGSKVLGGAKKVDKFANKYGRGALGRKLGEKARGAFKSKKEEPKKLETKRFPGSTAKAFKPSVSRKKKQATNRGGRRSAGSRAGSRRDRRRSYR